MRKIAVLFGVCMLLNAAATIAVSCRESTSTATECCEKEIAYWVGIVPVYRCTKHQECTTTTTTCDDGSKDISKTCKACQ
jgi:hypothetical protein